MLVIQFPLFFRQLLLFFTDTMPPDDAPAATEGASASAGGGSGKGIQSGPASMDDDGGGSETNWNDAKLDLGTGLQGDELFKEIPVGIREFMRTEKLLKQKHASEVST